MGGLPNKLIIQLKTKEYSKATHVSALLKTLGKIVEQLIRVETKC